MNDKTKTVRCKSCCAIFDVELNSEIIQCPYCGTKYSADAFDEESENIKVEKIKSQAYVDVETGKRQIESEILNMQCEQKKRDEYKKSKFSKILTVALVIFIIGAFLAFVTKHIPAGVIASLQAALVIFSKLVGSRLVKIKRWIGVIAAIFSFVLIIPYFNFVTKSTLNNYEHFVWKDDIVLSEMLPEPESQNGYIIKNNSKDLNLSIKGISDAQYAKYVEACKEKGFSVDADDSGSSFKAYDEEGYLLELSHISDTLHIELTSPIEMTELKWSDSEIVKLLPVPKSTVGNIDDDRSDYFSAVIGNTSLDEYNKYVEECSKKGFDIDHSKNDKSYYAYNKDKFYLSVSYEGNNIMKICISAPKEEEFSSVTQASSVQTSQPTSNETEIAETQPPVTEPPIASNLIRTEVKEALEAYEAFVDQYLEFMKKYSSANKTEMLDYLLEYYKYLDKLNEFDEKLNALEGELNDAELIYYSEVMLRCSKKLAEAVIS